MTFNNKISRFILPIIFKAWYASKTVFRIKKQLIASRLHLHSETQFRTIKKTVLVIIGLIWYSAAFAQLPKATIQPQRGFSFNFSNSEHKNFPQVVYVWPLSDAERAGLKSGMVIAKVNDTYFAKMSQEKITDFLINLSTQSLVFSFLNETKSSELTHPPRDINFGAFLPPVQTTHPDGECISGNCMDGEGYIKFTNRDYFRGVFEAGKPLKGDYFKAANGSRKLIPEVIDTTYKEYLYDITTVNGIGEQKFKRMYIPKSATADVHFESGRMYRGQRLGLVPHGKGEVHYSKNKIIDPYPSQSAEGKMILEGVFDNGRFVKATRLRTDAFTGMFIEGQITAGVYNYKYFWQVKDASLKVWQYSDAQNNRVDEVRTVFESKPGNYCFDGKFNGPGIWYCNQFGYSPLYGGEIHVLKMKDGFVQDSVELVLPHLNYRKKFSVVNYPRMFLRLDLLEYYIEIYYTTGKLPTGNWNTFTGGYVAKPPPPEPKTFKNSDMLKLGADIIKSEVKAAGKSGKIIAEGAVSSDKFLSTGYTVGDYLDYGGAFLLIVVTLKDAEVTVEGPGGKCTSRVITAATAPVPMKMYQCEYLQQQQYKGFFSFKTDFYKPDTEMYYVLYKITGK